MTRRLAAGAVCAAAIASLAAPAPAGAQEDDLPSAGEARERAGEILSGEEYSGSGDIGGDEPEGEPGADGGVPPPEEPDEGGFELPGLSASPGVSWLLYGAILAAIVALAIWLGRRAVDQEVAEAVRKRRADSPGLSDPDELELAAQEAERRGDAAAALRLRFQAALLRLAEAGAIKLRPSLTARGAGRQLRSPEFDSMVASFESVAYGGREPSSEETKAARESWPGVIERLGAKA